MLQLPSLDDNIPLPTHPTFLSDNLDAPKPFPEQQSLVSASAFDMSSIATVLHTLGDSLSGTFYSPNACRDELVNGTFQRTVRCVMTDGVIATGDLRADICRQAAHKYYGNILLAGERVPFGEHVSTQGMGRAVVQRRKAILPRESKTHIDCGYDGVGEGMVASNEERAKEEMRMAKLEKRKQKNRITAARSNDRKKERMKMQKIELQKLQDRKRELSMKKEQLQTENTMLKTLARSLD